MILQTAIKTFGARVSARRRAMAKPRRFVAEAAGMSERFLADVESGKANLSLTKALSLSHALHVPLSQLVENLDKITSPIVSLLGLRGAGKSTIGALLAKRMGIPFVELDKLVEQEAGMTLMEVFSLHGEVYFRKLEYQVLSNLLEKRQPVVVATSGGIVSSAAAFQLVLEGTKTIWLKAAPETHWDRVVAQRDFRPMANRPQAMSELRKRLKERESQYKRSEIIFETDGFTPQEAVPKLIAILSKT